MTLPAEPRLRLAAQAAVSCLLEERIDTFPVDPAAMIARRGWQLRTFSHAARRYSEDATAEVVSGLFGTRDAVTSVSMDHGKPTRYLICYNDLVDVPERVTFSLAHEIGHILLGHFICGEEELFTPAQRHVLDQEASAFASNLLAPAPVVALLRHPDREDMRQLFGLSKSGWQTRMETLTRDRLLLADSADALCRQFAGYMYRRQCTVCGAVFTDKPICPGCGSRALKWHPGRIADFPWTQDAWRTAARPDPLMLENPLADDARWHGDDRGIY
ncbi:MAG: ImmA/IrrE family metallo-endopeptidase [Clostridia bacterium]|nr:ImmA/IrrE family metallo-endopeptidase [Clostridia bacterium]